MQHRSPRVSSSPETEPRTRLHGETPAARGCKCLRRRPRTPPVSTTRFRPEPVPSESVGDGTNYVPLEPPKPKPNRRDDRTSTKTPVIRRVARAVSREEVADDKHSGLSACRARSNFRAQPNGNVYFSLKDRDAILNCVAFSERSATFPALKNGDDASAYGEVKVYPKTSVYQLLVLRVELSGVGALHAKFEELKLKLDRAGLFSDERKRPLPRFPFRIALVGSPNGDGTNDFLTQARQRAPHVEIRLIATPVNGPQAAPEIARAIARADAEGADAIVVVRGGGSYEDLFGFSDERVVRAIAAARTPTVVAIGHERDQTLAELLPTAPHRLPRRRRKRSRRGATNCWRWPPCERSPPRSRCGWNVRATGSI